MKLNATIRSRSFSSDVLHSFVRSKLFRGAIFSVAILTSPGVFAFGPSEDPEMRLSAATSAYVTCLEACSKDPQAKPEHVRQCVEKFCARFLPSDYLRKVDLDGQTEPLFEDALNGQLDI